MTQAKHLCTNCLKPGHGARACTASVCKRCSQKHHTLLHMENRDATTTHQANSRSIVASCYADQSSVPNTLLATCRIKVVGDNGREHPARAFLDAGSAVSLITTQFASKLGLPIQPTNVLITGVGQGSPIVRGSILTTIKSRNSGYASDVRLFIIDKISSNLPDESIDKALIHVPRNLTLADPQFNESGPIDMLIGAGIFYKLLSDGQFASNQQGISFQKSKLGWLLAGELPALSATQSKCNLTTARELNANIKRFWEIETPTEHKITRSPEDAVCLAHFKKTTTRDVNGRFNVRFPWKSDAKALGESYLIAKKRLQSMERKLGRDTELRTAYHDFMREYVELGHMREVDTSEDNGEPCYYVPHHAVTKESSLTTRLRIVFDFSAKTSSGVSLNDIIMTGPVLQDNLFSLILRFRIHQYVVTADVKKMYRQINMHADETRFQRILWRFDPKGPIKPFELGTVTYGAASSSFQAVNCLQQLSCQYEALYPVGAASVRKDFYMDDLLTGADNVTDARQIRDEVRTILQDGKFVLRKWASNDDAIISDVEGAPDEHLTLTSDKTPHIKALGIQWCPRSDDIEYTSNIITNKKTITKRNILSTIAGILDPLGLLGPIIIRAKIIMQHLWSIKLSWDENVPLEACASWQCFADQLRSMDKICIPRKVISAEGAQLELHGFSDASMEAYGACIYIKSTTNDGATFCTLMCAKSRVAPLKTVSLPRLELCAALLLAQLMETVRVATGREFISNNYYTDSTVTLAWIRACPSKFLTFVSNRTSQIQDLSRIEDWRHVNTAENPADVLSRGCTPARLLDHNLWWYGPAWLVDNARPMTSEEPFSSEELRETRKRRIQCHIVTAAVDLFERYSTDPHCSAGVLPRRAPAA